MSERCTYFESDEWANRRLATTRERLEAAGDAFALLEQEFDSLTDEERELIETIQDTLDDADLDALLADEEGRGLLLGAMDATDDLPTECPRDAVVGDRCLFHAPPDRTDDERVRDAFLDRVQAETDTRRSTQFVGATFGELDLSHRRIDGPDDFPIDLRYARFDSLDLTDATVGHPVRFDRCEFGAGWTRFGDVTFADAVEFSGARFADVADFENASFDDDATFTTVTFGGEARFRGARFGDTAAFHRASFADRGDFRETTFAAWARFPEATFAAGATFWGAAFDGPASFRTAAFGADPDFERSTFADRVSFEGTRPGDGSDLTVQLQDAVVAAGEIVVPADGGVVYDFASATVGDLEIDANGDPFEHVRFFLTEFDGFQFSRYRDALSPEWRIHSTVDGTSEDAPGDLESTYLKAKNGAKDVGDDRAASEFFLREKTFRRRLHWRVATDGPARRKRLLGAIQWLTSAFYAVTCGYGERPLRTVGVSIGLIVGFAPAFRVAGASMASSASPFSYVTFSFQSFVAFVLGSVPGEQPTLVRFLAAIEAFAGAFLVALFVFSLTRSIHR